MEKTTVHGFLLKITPLASGDALLRFFTSELGIVTVGFKSFEKSQKRKQHIDYFRVLECVLRPTKNNWKADKCEGKALFSGMLSNYKLTEKAFSWLELIDQTLQDEKEAPELFQTLSHAFNYIDPDNVELLDMYVRMMVLKYAGIMRRFDTIRGDVYLDPLSFSFSDRRNHQQNLFIPNQARQLLEFLRRSTFEEVYEKKDALPKGEYAVIFETLDHLHRHHI